MIKFNLKTIDQVNHNVVDVPTLHELTVVSHDFKGIMHKKKETD